MCSARCRDLWLGRRNIRVLNKPGHSKGHKAPHLTELNRERNPLCCITQNQRHSSSKVYRRMAEEWLGRKLLKGEVVHHINGDRADNRPENFMVMTAKEHKWLHMRIALRRYAKGGDAQCQKK